MIFGGFVSAFSQRFYFEPNIYETCIVFRITTLIKRKHQDRQSLKLHAIRAAVTVQFMPKSIALEIIVNQGHEHQEEHCVMNG